MQKAKRMKLEAVATPKDKLELGSFYAMPEKDGYLLVMAASINSKDVIVILGTHGTQTSDDPPVWVWPSSIAASECYELKGTHIFPAHSSGTMSPTGDSDRSPRHGELIEDDQQRPFLFLKQKQDRLAILLDDGRAFPPFDATLIYGRWRLLQNGAQLLEFEVFA